MRKTSQQLLASSDCTNCRHRGIDCDRKRPVCGSYSCKLLPSTCKYADSNIPLDNRLVLEEIAVQESRLHQLQRSPPSQSPPSSWAVQHSLLQNFFAHSSEFGFFLNIPRFSASLVLSSPQQQPFPRVLSSCQVLGALFSPSKELYALRVPLLSQALHNTSIPLPTNPSEVPQNVLHCIQAQTLLSQYFFINGQAHLGKYHLIKAISTVLAAGFHKIRSADLHLFQGGRAGLHSLPPPVDSIEEGERINALWQVVILNACWTSVDGSESNISYDNPDSRIDTPWPLDSNSYSDGNLAEQGRYTIQQFLANAPDSGHSLTALHAKAAILFEKATQLRKHYQPGIIPSQQTDYYQKAFYTLDRQIRSILHSLRSLSSAPRATRARRLLLTHTLCHTATIQLYGIFRRQDPAATAKVLSAAESIVGILKTTNLRDLPCIDPLIGHLWMSTANVFITEISNLGNINTTLSSLNTSISLNQLMNSTQIILSTMEIFAGRSPLMASQLKEISHSYMTARASIRS